MKLGQIMGYIDVAQVTLYAFWAFFAGLILYIRNEDRREGYPLVSEPDGKVREGFIYLPEPKVFNMEDGRTIMAPGDRGDNRAHNMVKAEPWPGAPFVPTGDPMLAFVGPGSYAERSNKPDLMHGTPKIVPLRAATQYFIESREPDPRGMSVVGADGRSAGTVTDLWVDRMETLIRYLEVDLGAGKKVLLPMNFATINKRRGEVEVGAIMSHQFANVPGLSSPDQISLLEEDKITAYFGAGTLYAEPSRAEPLL